MRDKSKLRHGETVNDLEKKEAKPKDPSDKKLGNHPQTQKIVVYKASWKRNSEKNYKEVVKLKDNINEQTRGFTKEFNKEGVVQALKMPAFFNNT